MSPLIQALLLGAFFTVHAWSLYNLPILVAGVENLLKSRKKSVKELLTEESLPRFSIVVPAKNEYSVIGRLFEALEKIDYPLEKREVIVVEDGSTDKTLEACEDYAALHREQSIRILRKGLSNGKPSALNYGIKHAHGEVVAVFDADSVPARDVLLNASRYFGDSKVAAVQGRTMPINSEENMLTKFVSYEDLVWCEVYLRGKDALDLFVHLRGSCQFIRRSVLDDLNGFDESTLSEDMELSARLAEKGHRIRYASDVCTWQETPVSLGGFFKQRMRWLRGTMEVAFRYGRLMAKPSMKSLDAEATLLGPFILIVSLLTYFAALFTLFAPFSSDFLLPAVMRFSALVTTAAFFVSGLALVCASKPRKIGNVLWLPFIYFYWFLQTFIALYALMLIAMRRPQRWVRTEKTGSVKNPVLD